MEEGPSLYGLTSSLLAVETVLWCGPWACLAWDRVEVDKNRWAISAVRTGDTQGGARTRGCNPRRTRGLAKDILGFDVVSSSELEDGWA